MKYNPKGIGQKSEAQILALFLKNNMKVLLPFGDNERYDLVVEEKGDFIRVQCKTGRFTDANTFLFKPCSTNWNTKKSKTYTGDIDIFAVYVRELDSVYVFSIKGIPNTSSCQIRLTKTKSGRIKGVRLAENYLFQPGKSLRDYE